MIRCGVACAELQTGSELSRALVALLGPATIPVLLALIALGVSWLLAFALHKVTNG